MAVVRKFRSEKSKELFLDFEQNRSPNGQSVNNKLCLMDQVIGFVIISFVNYTTTA